MTIKTGLLSYHDAGEVSVANCGGVFCCESVHCTDRAIVPSVGTGPDEIGSPPWNDCRVRALEWSGALRRC
jgi:hypothetical protein